MDIKAGPILAAAVLLMGTVVPVLAIFENNTTVIGIRNLAESISNTGLNSQSSGVSLTDSDHDSFLVGTNDRTMTTGAATANATATVNATTNNTSNVFGVDLEGTAEVTDGLDLGLWFNLDNLTFADSNVSGIEIDNRVKTGAYTGQNIQDDVVVGSGLDHASVGVGTGVRTMTTGAAATTSTAGVTINAINVSQFGL